MKCYANFCDRMSVHCELGIMPHGPDCHTYALLFKILLFNWLDENISSKSTNLCNVTIFLGKPAWRECLREPKVFWWCDANELHSFLNPRHSLLYLDWQHPTQVQFWAEDKTFELSVQFLNTSVQLSLIKNKLILVPQGSSSQGC